MGHLCTNWATLCSKHSFTLFLTHPREGSRSSLDYPLGLLIGESLCMNVQEIVCRGVDGSLNADGTRVRDRDRLNRQGPQSFPPPACHRTLFPFAGPWPVLRTCEALCIPAYPVLAVRRPAAPSCQPDVPTHGAVWPSSWTSSSHPSTCAGAEMACLSACCVPHSTTGPPCVAGLSSFIPYT